MSICKKSLCAAFSMCLLTLTGCLNVTKTQNEVHYLAELPTVEQINLNVELRLTNEFRTTNLVYKETGHTFYTPLGNPLSTNAEIVARKAFKEVTVSKLNAENPPSHSNIQAVLIPEVAVVKRDRPATIISTQTTTLHLVWTLRRPDDSLLWTTTVEAVGKGPMGPVMISRNAGAKQVRTLLQDAAEKSLNKLVSSAVIQQYAQSFDRKNN